MPVLKSKIIEWNNEEVLVKYGIRKTVQLKVKQGQLQINAPLRISQKWLVEFLDQRLDWINHIRSQQSIKQSQQIETLKSLNSQSKIWYKGQIASCVNPKTFYHQTGAKELLEIAQNWQINLSQFKIKDFKLRTMKGRWGSCSLDGTITLNRYLIGLPPHLIDLVIVHEFVHRAHFDHSPAFYGKLVSILPLAKQWQKELKVWGPVLEH